MAVAAKDPSSSIDYHFDWGVNYLQGAEKIINVSFAVHPQEAGGVTLGINSFNDTSSWTSLSGGINNHSYRLTCTITTDSARIDERSAIIRVQER